MQNLVFSYALTLDTKIKVGTVPGGMVQEDVNFLYQDGGNTLENGKSLKLAIQLGAGSGQARELDLRDYGMNYLRTLLIKVTDSNGSSNTLPVPLKVKLEISNVETGETTTLSSKTTFIDYGEPGTLPVPVKTEALGIKLTNLNSTAVSLILVAVGY